MDLDRIIGISKDTTSIKLFKKDLDACVKEGRSLLFDSFLGW